MSVQSELDNLGKALDAKTDMLLKIAALLNNMPVLAEPDITTVKASVASHLAAVDEVDAAASALAAKLTVESVSTVEVTPEAPTETPSGS